MGHVYQNNLNPKNCFQFADDAVAVTSNEYENQVLLNMLTRLYVWSHMTFRIDECMSLGICKKGSTSVQCKPTFHANASIIRPLEEGESFRYLGMWFSLEMDNQKHKDELLQITTQIMDRINSLPLHPKNKVWLYSQYLMSKLSWHLTIADIDQTWIINNLDTLAHNYLRRWLEIPASRKLSIVMLTNSQFGLNIVGTSTKFKQYQVS